MKTAEQHADEALKNWPTNSQPMIRLGVRDLLIQCVTAARAEGKAEGFAEGVEAGRSHLRKRACEFEADDMRATARYFRESADALLKLTPPRHAEPTTARLCGGWVSSAKGDNCRRPLGHEGECVGLAESTVDEDHHFPTCERCGDAICYGPCRCQRKPAEATASEPHCADVPVGFGCPSCEGEHAHASVTMPASASDAEVAAAVVAELSKPASSSRDPDNGHGPSATEAPVLDSPNFTPQALKDFAERGFQRIGDPRWRVHITTVEREQMGRELAERMRGHLDRLQDRAEKAERDRDELRAEIGMALGFIEEVNPDSATAKRLRAALAKVGGGA